MNLYLIYLKNKNVNMLFNLKKYYTDILKNE